MSRRQEGTVAGGNFLWFSGHVQVYSVLDGLVHTDRQTRVKYLCVSSRANPYVAWHHGEAVNPYEIEFWWKKGTKFRTHYGVQDYPDIQVGDILFIRRGILNATTWVTQYGKNKGTRQYAVELKVELEIGDRYPSTTLLSRGGPDSISPGLNEYLNEFRNFKSANPAAGEVPARLRPEVGHDLRPAESGSEGTALAGLGGERAEGPRGGRGIPVPVLEQRDAAADQQRPVPPAVGPGGGTQPIHDGNGDNAGGISTGGDAGPQRV